MVPPGRSSPFRIARAATGRERCSRTKQTKTWSKDSASKGGAKTSACRSSTFASPARSTLRLASAIESAERSTDVNRAPGLRWARVTVWAPTPHPTSSTVLPPGYAVSACSRSTSVPAWSCRRSFSRSEEHTSELQSRPHLVCRLLLEKKKENNPQDAYEYTSKGNLV